eukprot:6175177-Pleurochrysis_carterae.AAC.1
MKYRIRRMPAGNVPTLLCDFGRASRVHQLQISLDGRDLVRGDFFGCVPLPMNTSARCIASNEERRGDSCANAGDSRARCRAEWRVQVRLSVDASKEIVRAQGSFTYFCEAVHYLLLSAQ